MGGAKKPTTANKDKSAGGKEKKSKKDKGSESGPKRAEIIVKVNDGQALKIIKNSKVTTVQDLARQLGVKISAANVFLKKAVSDGSISVVGGYSGHYLYQDTEMAEAAKKAKAKKKESKPPEPKADKPAEEPKADKPAEKADAAAEPATAGTTDISEK